MRCRATYVAIVVLAACDGTSATPPTCEQGAATVTARTVDGFATIASVELVSQGGTCALGPRCTPRMEAPCEEVSITGFPIGVTCMFTFTSTTGVTMSAKATLE